nr:MAG TPA: hypothetical protein [Caudoviricetes sp.]
MPINRGLPLSIGVIPLFASHLPPCMGGFFAPYSWRFKSVQTKFSLKS